jgi:hypothetical protein
VIKSAKEIERMFRERFENFNRFDRNAPQYKIFQSLDSLIYEINNEIGELVFDLRDGVPECEHYALGLHWEIKRRWPQYFFGEAWGMPLFGIDNHKANVTITEDRGIVLIEPQKVGMWKIPQEDNVIEVVTA